MPEPSQFKVDRTDPGRWTITFCNPPINMFVPTTIVELGALVADLEADSSVKVVVFPVGHPWEFRPGNRAIECVNNASPGSHFEISFDNSTSTSQRDLQTPSLPSRNTSRQAGVYFPLLAPRTAQLGRARLPQPRVLQRTPEGRSLRRLGTTGTLCGRDASGVQVAALIGAHRRQSGRIEESNNHRGESHSQRQAADPPPVLLRASRSLDAGSNNEVIGNFIFVDIGAMMRGLGVFQIAAVEFFTRKEEMRYA